MPEIKLGWDAARQTRLALPAQHRWRCQGVAPGTKMITMTDPQRLKDLLEAFNAHDLDRIMAFFAHDCVLETPRGTQPWGTRFVGRDAVRKGLGQRFEGLPDAHYGEDEHWVCGGHAVSRWLLTGITTSGERLRLRGCDLFDLTPDGHIRRKDSYWKLVG